MTDEDQSPVRDTFDSHAAFEPRDGRFDYVKTPFDATVTVDETDDAGEETYHVIVSVRVPTLDAVVAGETVADVIEDGWYETFERRLEDAFDVARSDGDPPAVERGADDEVIVELSFETEAAGRVVEDAAALVEYVEGTYVQGVVPGYDYLDPVAGLLDRARQAAEEPERGGSGR
ncbi:MAG: hypothetical protein ACI91T_002865 [Natronomonas sp.]|jgi:hypothetical protein